MRAFPLVLGVALSLGGPALATPNFPVAVRTAAGMSSVPGCSLCHFNDVTGVGTVTTPFGKSMLARGLIANDDRSVTSATSRMVADKVDSDGDGLTDVDELKAGTDPNRASAGTVPPPTYGCTEASGQTVIGWVLLAGLFSKRRGRSEGLRRL